MRQTLLAEDGPCVSALGLGCNNFGINPYGQPFPYSRCKEVVDAALDAGYTYFDTAEVYAKGGSEALLGQALRRRRGEVVVATKFGSRSPMPGAPTDRTGSPEYVNWAIDESLRRLRTDYIDVYQLHQPDPNTPIGETLGALEQLRSRGKIRFFGLGGFSGDQLSQAVEAAATNRSRLPVSHMTYYSLLTRKHEEELIPTCLRLGIKVHPWFVLESGLLTGKFTRARRIDESSRASAFTETLRGEVWDALERLRSFAEAHGVSMIELAIGGVAATPGVGVVIVGASTGEQVRANAEALDWVPTALEIEELQALPWASPDERLGSSGEQPRNT